MLRGSVCGRHICGQSMQLSTTAQKPWAALTAGLLEQNSMLPAPPSHRNSGCVVPTLDGTAHCCCYLTWHSWGPFLNVRFLNWLELCRLQLLFCLFVLFSAEKYRSSMKLVLRPCGEPRESQSFLKRIICVLVPLCRDDNRHYCHQAVSNALSHPTDKFPADTTPLKSKDFPCQRL